MVTPTKIPYRKGKPKLSTPAGRPPAAALNLTAAFIDDDVTMVTLQFGRAIDIVSIDVTAIQVGTITTGGLYQGDIGASLTDARTVQVPLTLVGGYPQTNVELFATADSGIIAVNDGGTWAGTGGTELPYS